ncbi:MAG TPA: glycosyltransferase 87 family protein [Amnibacterium sp.]|uniref:glycosyltransferase 87 family protein n=1 Tax=Amnibacterium sp. TaxID=1872496 RepID=UPI002F95D953
MTDAPARTVSVVVTVLALSAVTWLVAGAGIVLQPDWPGWLIAEGAAWLLFAAAVVLLRSVPNRIVPALVIGGAVVIGVAALAGPPDTSTDSARYAWDGIVQDAGISPYRYVPADAALRPLRPDWLFPAVQAPSGGALRCPDSAVHRTTQVGASGMICTAINRPLVPTIYPPVAEAAFAAVRFLVAPTVAYGPMQVLGLLTVLGTTAVLLVTLRRSGDDPRRAAWFAWCPLVASEAVTNAHVDGLATLLAVAGTVLALRGATIRGGVLLGAAITTKVLPVLVVPPLLRRSPVRLLGAAAGTVVVVYLPHVVASGSRVLGYLPGYLNEEGYDNGTRSVLVSLIVPPPLVTPTSALLLAVVTVLVLIKADPAAPWAGQAVMIGSALLLISPRFPWYALLLTAFAAAAGRWEWFALPLVLIGARAGVPLPLFRAELCAVLVLVVVVGLVRRRAARGAPRFLRAA